MALRPQSAQAMGGPGYSWRGRLAAMSDLDNYQQQQAVVVANQAKAVADQAQLATDQQTANGLAQTAQGSIQAAITALTAELAALPPAPAPAS
jgi:hypothetical protein